MTRLAREGVTARTATITAEGARVVPAVAARRSRSSYCCDVAPLGRDRGRRDRRHHVATVRPTRQRDVNEAPPKALGRSPPPASTPVVAWGLQCPGARARGQGGTVSPPLAACRSEPRETRQLDRRHAAVRAPRRLRAATRRSEPVRELDHPRRLEQIGAPPRTPAPALPKGDSRQHRLPAPTSEITSVGWR